MKESSTYKLGRHVSFQMVVSDLALCLRWLIFPCYDALIQRTAALSRHPQIPLYWLILPPPPPTATTTYTYGRADHAVILTTFYPLYITIMAMNSQPPSREKIWICAYDNGLLVVHNMDNSVTQSQIVSH